MQLSDAYRWLTVWTLFAQKCDAHIGSLDPRTDRLAVIEWSRRAFIARLRAQIASVRFDNLCR